MTSMGLRARRAPLCHRCRERKESQLYTIDVNGNPVCGDCSGAFGRGVLREDEESPFDVLPDSD